MFGRVARIIGFAGVGNRNGLNQAEIERIVGISRQYIAGIG